MSDSELSDAPSNEFPLEEEIEATLKKEVTRASKGPLEDYTVSKIRKAAEEVLGLPDGFLKENQNWQARSKSVIQRQVEIESASRTADDSQTNSKEPVRPSEKSEPSTKRSSQAESIQPRKKQKVESDADTSALSSPPDDSEEDFEEKKPSKAKRDTKKSAPTKAKTKSVSRLEGKAKSTKNVSDEDELSDKEGSGEAEAESGSEMSVVLDEAPIKKSRSKNDSASASAGNSKAPKTKSKAGASGGTDPDQEEIKKLQGWLVKCGIRKVWGKELKPFGTSKAKIKHLRGMLADAGMTGRFSNEKASQIKEARELAADIEAVQEGNERWGKDGEEDDDGDSKTRGGRRLVRGAKAYDFLSSDGEETD